MAHQSLPPENFFSKGLRYAQQGVSLMGTARGLIEGGRYLYNGFQYARPFLAML